MKIGLVQMAVGVDKEENLRRACGEVAAMARCGAEMVVLPEMFLCPYDNKCFPEYGEEAGQEAWLRMSDAARENGVYLVGGSIPEKAEGKLYNTSFVFDPDGRQLGRHRKMHLFDIDVKGGQRFMESEVLTPGDEVTVVDTKWGKVGVCICFDMRFPELARLMTLKGARLLVVPAAFNMTTGPRHWELMFRQRAVDNQLFTVGVAPARDVSGGYVSYANSMVASPWGDVVYRAGAEPVSQVVELDLSLVDEVRKQLPLLSARRVDVYRRENFL